MLKYEKKWYIHTNLGSLNLAISASFQGKFGFINKPKSLGTEYYEKIIMIIIIIILYRNNGYIQTFFPLFMVK